MFTHQQLIDFEATSRFLHYLLMHYPDCEMVSFMNDNQIVKNWKDVFPGFEKKELKLVHECIEKAAKNEAELNRIKLDYTELFIGLGPVLAPLNGSVYTNRHNLLNSNSTLDLKDFLKKSEINVVLKNNEPIDNIGVILLIMSDHLSLFRGNENCRHDDKIFNLLVEEHLLPWGYRCAYLIESNAKTHFYSFIGKALGLLLFSIEQQQHLKPKKLILYK